MGALAAADGLFAWSARRLERLPGSAHALYLATLGLVAAVTIVLNLDTAVVFLTPVAIGAALRRRVPVAPFLYGTVIVANGASLLLPGSNLTNLIVLGAEHVPGGAYLARMAAPAAAALAATVAVLLARYRRSLRARLASPAPGRPDATPPAGALGIAATVSAGLLVLALPHPAPWVLLVAVGFTVVAVRRGLLERGDALRRLDLPVLLALLALSVLLGTLARQWAGPHDLVAGLGRWPTTAVAALSSVALNNLPASVLLSSGPVAHPRALIIGLNLGPNLFVTGSLAVYLWWRAAQAHGEEPSVTGYVRAALPAALAGMAAALLALGA